MGWRRRGAAGVKKGRAGDCGGIGIPATSPVIPGGRCGAGKEGERRALTRGPGVAERVGARERYRGCWQVGKGRRGLGAGRRAVRGERAGELGRARLLGRARGRAGLIAGQAGMEPGRVRGKGKGPWGKDGLVCFGFGFKFSFFWVFFSFSYSFLFLIQTSLNSNTNLNSNHTQFKVCTSMNAQQFFFKPRQILITCEAKLN